jgi:hypothetical protein
MSCLVAFDSNVLTAFLIANSSPSPSLGDTLDAFRLFLYARSVTILPTITVEALRIPQGDKRREHLTWVWYHFPEAQLRDCSGRIDNRMHELLPHHPEHDADDCRIIAEAEVAGVEILSTFDKKVRRIQPQTCVQLLTPARSLEVLGVAPGTHPYREPAIGHPHANNKWWRL